MPEARDYGDPTSPGIVRRPATADTTSRQRRDRTREHRRKMSLPEVLLWQQLRGRDREFRFRRQHPVGPYSADFYCHEVSLVVEVDSSWHNRRVEEDARRDEWMRTNGYRVIRIAAQSVLRSPEGVASWLCGRVRELRDRDTAAETESQADA